MGEPLCDRSNCSMTVYVPQFWRFLTPFFVHAPSFQFLIDMILIYRNSADLETKRGSPHHFMSICFCIVAMLAMAPFVDVVFWGRALVHAVRYMWANEFPGHTVAFWGVIKMKVTEDLLAVVRT